MTSALSVKTNSWKLSLALVPLRRLDPSAFGRVEGELSQGGLRFDGEHLVHRVGIVAASFLVFYDLLTLLS
jgi:hypothetical protein